MKQPLLLLLISSLTGSIGSIVLASDHATIIAEAGPQRVSLLEMFTSEGCSSCPPAEKQMAELMTSKLLWKDIVPVAFHVDYWDYLGWKDVLASAAFTRRQRSYARAWNSTTVYTPAFVLDGKEWKGNVPPAQTGKDAPGRLVIERKTAHEFQVSFFPAAGFSGGTCTLVLLAFNRISDIRSGENAGSRLNHQFAVLEMSQTSLSLDPSTGAWTAILTISQLNQRNLAVAAWVAAPDNLAPVQAAGGWLTSSQP